MTEKQAYAEWTDDDGQTTRSGIEPIATLARWVRAMLKMHPGRDYEVVEYDDGAVGGG